MYLLLKLHIHTYILNGIKYFQHFVAISGTLVIINDLYSQWIYIIITSYKQTNNKNHGFCSCSGSQDPGSTFKVKYFFIIFPPKVIFLINSFTLVKSVFYSVVLQVLSCWECDFEQYILKHTFYSTWLLNC